MAKRPREDFEEFPGDENRGDEAYEREARRELGIGLGSEVAVGYRRHQVV